MKKVLYKLLILSLAILSTPSITNAQTKFGGIVELDKTVHDFGNILIEDGPVDCAFTVTNISKEPVAIASVISSCGCTDVSWTREPLAPGKSGKISATFDNQDGPYPFDKTLTVYVTGYKQGIVLRLRGIAHEKEKTLEELYPEQISTLGLSKTEIKSGNILQGQQKGGDITIANLGKSPMNLSFDNISPQLSISVSPNPIPSRGTAKLTYSIKADQNLWGKNFYYATPIINGKNSGKKLSFWAITRENFNDWTKEQKDKAANPIFGTSTFSFKPMKAGEKVNATFNLTNNGKSDLVIYKAYSDSDRVTIGNIPKLAAGKKHSFNVILDTEDMPKGEVLVIVSLVTNSPIRPLVNLYITGFIQ